MYSKILYFRIEFCLIYFLENNGYIYVYLLIFELKEMIKGLWVYYFVVLKNNCWIYFWYMCIYCIGWWWCWLICWFLWILICCCCIVEIYGIMLLGIVVVLWICFIVWICFWIVEYWVKVKLGLKVMSLIFVLIYIWIFIFFLRRLML